jgi:hypothetical protein
MIKKILNFMGVNRWLIGGSVIALVLVWGYGEVKENTGKKIGRAEMVSACVQEAVKENEKAKDNVKKIKRKVKLTDRDDDIEWFRANGLLNSDS